jgi:hypothetical protein
VAGAVIIVVVLLIFPLLVALGGFVLAAALGWLLNDDANARFEGSELVELNR